MILTLTHEGADSLREFANKLPIATQNIEIATRKLNNIFKSLYDELGVHREDFEELFSTVESLQKIAINAISILIPRMNRTAEKIDEYVDQQTKKSFSSTILRDKTQSSPIRNAPVYNKINRGSGSLAEVAAQLNLNSGSLFELYTKNQNKQDEICHELWQGIRHPYTGEKLKSVKGYYVQCENEVECVYAEFEDAYGAKYYFIKEQDNDVKTQVLACTGTMKEVEGLVKELADNPISKLWAKQDGEHCSGFDLRETNKKYYEDSKEYKRYKINCQRCVPAYEMRRRGYDVVAKPKAKGKDYLSINPFSAWKNAVVLNTSDTGKQDIEHTMSSWEEGARAQVVIYWKGSKKGHTFIAEKANGEVCFVDPQNENYDASRYFDRVQKGETVYCRIDNLDPTARIRECCEDRLNDIIKRSM